MIVDGIPNRPLNFYQQDITDSDRPSTPAALRDTVFARFQLALSPGLVQNIGRVVHDPGSFQAFPGSWPFKDAPRQCMLENSHLPVRPLRDATNAQLAFLGVPELHAPSYAFGNAVVRDRSL